MTINTIASNAATSSANAAAGAAATSTAQSALGSLSGNFDSFLTLLTTQLKNQDPTAPMDTNTFTSQLVQYSSVEQQINTNTNLAKLIQATQSNTVLQSSSLVGEQVDVTSDHLPLQNGAALAHFTAPTAETVNVAVYSASGTKVLQTTIDAQAGANDWRWNGRDDQGAKVADGSYRFAINETSGAALPTTVTGKITALQRGTSGLSVSLGALNTDVANIQSVASGS